MRKVFGIVVVTLFMSGFSLNAKTSKLEEDVYYDCSGHADGAASLSAEGHYWEVWFEAFAHCAERSYNNNR